MGPSLGSYPFVSNCWSVVYTYNRTHPGSTDIPCLLSVEGQELRRVSIALSLLIGLGMGIRSIIGGGMFRSYLEPRNLLEIAHLGQSQDLIITSRRSWSPIWIRVFPSLQCFFRFLKNNLSRPITSVLHPSIHPSVHQYRSEGASFPYPQLSRLLDVSVCFKQLPDIKRLGSPDVPSNGPVQGQLKTAAVKAPVGKNISREIGRVK